MGTCTCVCVCMVRIKFRAYKKLLHKQVNGVYLKCMGKYALCNLDVNSDLPSMCDFAANVGTQYAEHIEGFRPFD